jgi:hypothetical protein
MLARRIAKRVAMSVPPLRRLFDQRDHALQALARTDELANELRAKLAVRANNSASVIAESRTLQEDIHWMQTPEGLVRRILQADAGTLDETTLPPPAPSKSIITDDFRQFLKEVMDRTFFRDFPVEQRSGEIYLGNMRDHVEGRYTLFADCIVPWLKSVSPDLSCMTAVEVGSGTGASSLAFATQVKKLICYEIEDLSIEAARERLGYFGLDNVEFHRELFGPSCGLVASGEKVDLVVLCAVLEHMTFQELRDCLSTAWTLLNEGGLLLVADTPNRFAVFDAHTSLLPYFSALPREIKQAYARDFSPRDHFRTAIADAPPGDIDLLLTRWGSGISFHEFELAIGRNVHDHVVLTGYEPILRNVAPPTVDDAILRFSFSQYGLAVSPAFTRANMYFVLRKPDDAS